MPKYLLFTDKEEIDCIGAKDFVNEYKSKINVDFIIEFDCGRDYAVFSMKKENGSLESLFSKYFIIKKSSYTCDIDVLKEGFDACGVNIGVGYEKWHKLDETININMLENQIIKSTIVIEKILSKGY